MKVYYLVNFKFMQRTLSCADFQGLKKFMAFLRLEGLCYDYTLTTLFIVQLVRVLFKMKKDLNFFSSPKFLLFKKL